jgi:hypothetical protein
MNANTTPTPEELAEQFPCTGSPFAVWYNPDPNADHRKWVVNDSDGSPCFDLADIVTALKKAAEIGREWDAKTRHQAQESANVIVEDLPPKITQKQMELALDEITTMADVLRHLCMEAMQGNSAKNAAAACYISSQIGYIADRCLGFDGFGPDHFLSPTLWNKEESGAHHA